MGVTKAMGETDQGSPADTRRILLTPVRHLYAVLDPSAVRQTCAVIIGISLVIYLAAPPYLALAGYPYYARKISLFYGVVLAAIIVGDLLVTGVLKGLHDSARRPQEAEDKPTGRLSCYGESGELAPLRHLHALRFPPQVSYVLHAMRRQHLALWFVGLLTIQNLLVLWGQYEWGLPLALLAGAPFLLQWLRPKYYRVVPGRLEVIQYSFLRYRPEIVTYTLVDATITGRYDERLVTLSSGGQEVRIDLSKLRNPHRFVEMLFRAALSPNDSLPALPEETLVG